KYLGVLSIRVAADGKSVCALLGPSEALQSPLLVAWNADTGEILNSTRVFDTTRWSFDLSPDAGLLSSNGDPARVVPVAEQSVDHLKEVNLRSGWAAEFSDDGKWLTLIARTNTPGGEVRQWAVVVSTRTWKDVCSVSAGLGARAALSPDGKTLAVAVGEKLEFYDTVTAKVFGSYKLPAEPWETGFLGYTR